MHVIKGKMKTKFKPKKIKTDDTSVNWWTVELKFTSLRRYNIFWNCRNNKINLENSDTKKWSNTCTSKLVNIYTKYPYIVGADQIDTAEEDLIQWMIRIMCEVSMEKLIDRKNNDNEMLSEE